MVIAEAPSSVVLSYAIVADAAEAYQELEAALRDGTDDRLEAEWVRSAEAVEAAVDAARHDGWVVDATSELASRVWSSLEGETLGAWPIVAVVGPASEADGPEVEVVPRAELTGGRLHRALRRARNRAAVWQELRRERAQVAAQRDRLRELEKDQERKARLLQGITQNLPLLLGRLDRKGRVVEIHGTGIGRSGIRPEHLLRHRLSLVLPQARDAVRQALAGTSATFAVRGRSGEHEWHADFVVLPETSRDGGAIFLGRDVSERRWLEQQLLTASDAEQQRIGADLHDGLGQQLTGLACLVAALRDRLQAAHLEELAGQADFIVEVANDATRQSRALARGLCPVQLEGSSLELALEDLVYQAQQLHGIQCHFRSRGEMPPFDHYTAIHLYRITQEALHNAVRHGLARNVWVTLVSRGSRYRLTIADDGCGFDSHQPTPVASRGLRLMNYRAGIIGGALSVITRPGRGTRVICQFAHASALHEDSS